MKLMNPFRYIQENYTKICDVERERANLSMQMKLTAGPKKSGCCLIFVSYSHSAVWWVFFFFMYIKSWLIVFFLTFCVWYIFLSSWSFEEENRDVNGEIVEIFLWFEICSECVLGNGEELNSMNKYFGGSLMWLLIF